jgi:transposase
MDTSKHIFQLHGVNTAEEPVLRKKLRRKEMFAFLEQLAPTVIAIEACGASHHCARLLQSFRHSVKLIAPQLVKPYLKRGKNDAADAEALCEAMSRPVLGLDPTMRFVPVKTADRQAALMLVGVRDQLIRNRTQLSNAIRGYAGEFGLTAAKGRLTAVRCSSAPKPMRACPPWLATVRGPGPGICATAGANRPGRCQADRLASRR